MTRSDRESARSRLRVGPAVGLGDRADERDPLGDREDQRGALRVLGVADSPAAAAWLMDYYEDRGDWSDALEWRRHEFEQQPDLLNYRAVRRAAMKAKRWPELADELLEARAALLSGPGRS